MNLARLNLLGYGSQFPIPFDPYLKMKEDTYNRFWPEKAALPDPPLRQPFTGDYYLDEIDSPFLKALAYLYNSQNLKDAKTDFSSGGAGAGRQYGPRNGSEPAPRDLPIEDQHIIDFVSSIMNGKAQPAQGAGTADFASVVRGMPKASIITALHAAPIQFDPSRSPSPERAVSLPDATRVESSGEPSPHPVPLNEEILPAILTDTRMGLPTFKVGGEVEVKGKRPSKELKQKPLPRDDVSMAVDEKTAEIPMQTDTGGGGMPTWAKILMGLGGLGAIAAIAKNGKFVQPGGRPLNWGRGLSMGAAAAGQSIEKNAERKREAESEAKQMINDLMIAQMRNAPSGGDAMDFWKAFSSDVREEAFANLEPGQMPPVGASDLLTNAINSVREREMQKAEENRDFAKLRAIESLSYLAYNPMIRNDPAFTKLINKVYKSNLFGLADEINDEDFERAMSLNAEVPLFGQ